MNEVHLVGTYHDLSNVRLSCIFSTQIQNPTFEVRGNKRALSTELHRARLVPLHYLGDGCRSVSV